MKKTLLVILSLGLFNAGVFAQDDNLVTNPMFEEHDGKLKKPGQLSVASGWTPGTAGAVDLYKKGHKNPLISIPENKYGTQKDEDGDSYIGMVMYAYQNKVPRGYAVVQLATPLKAGAKYCVQFDVALSELSKYSVNNIGAHFSKKKVALDNENHLLLEPHVTTRKNEVIEEMSLWTTVCNVYEAKGGEKFMTLGNFQNNDNTEFKKMKRPKGVSGSQVAVAYYYLDNVRVRMIEAYDECECEKKNPYAQQTNIVYSYQVISETELSPKEVVDNCKVYYAYNKSNINNTGVRNLDALAAVLQANPDMKLKVRGHLDIREKEAADESGFNGDLGKTRAQKVIDYLVGKGISADRLILEDVIAAEPVDSSGTEIGKAKNRRVQFVLTE